MTDDDDAYKSLQRKEFEEWVSGQPYCENIERFPPERHSWPGCYKSLKVMLAWDAWCEAWRRAAE